MRTTSREHAQSRRCVLFFGSFLHGFGAAFRSTVGAVELG